MKTLRCLIVDDKPLAIDMLVAHTQKIPFLELAGTTTNPIEALDMLRQQTIDLVFLDIQMPELTGLQFIKIAGRQCRIILTTAYSEYALDGYEHDVVDYLLKPIAFERFYRAAEKARQLIMPVAAEVKATATVADTPREFLFVKTEYRIQKINLDDILFIEGLQNYIAIYTPIERIISLQPLKKIEEQLPPLKFARVQKSFIIALKHITSIERSRISIGDRLIPVGDAYREGFYRLVNI
jgi:two-component system LytT family response regulator